MSQPPTFGLSCALATPFTAGGEFDVTRFIGHAGWCLGHGCDSVTVFGTTGEGASVGLSTRAEGIRALQASGIDLRTQVVVGIAASAQDDAAAQIRMLLDADIRALLLAPPFYFKEASDDGLFAWFSAVFDAAGDGLRDVLLYNIPSVTSVAISPNLVGRLRHAYPGVIAGVKDSSGDWDSTSAHLLAHGDIAILVGDERQLARGMAQGAQGAISGMANFMPERLAKMVRAAQPDDVVSGVVGHLLEHAVTPAVKSLLADSTGDDAWRRVRPPLCSLEASAAARLRANVSALWPPG